jgi:hypothetical protein
MKADKTKLLFCPTGLPVHIIVPPTFPEASAADAMLDREENNSNNVVKRLMVSNIDCIYRSTSYYCHPKQFMAYVLCYYVIIQDIMVNVIIVYTILMRLASQASGLD